MDVHNSTAIEGNTLVLREVEALLNQGKAVGAKELKDYMEVLGYGEAAAWVYSAARPTVTSPGNPNEASSEIWAHDSIVTLTEIREIHRRAMAHVWTIAPHPAADDSEAPGNFRQHEILAFPGGMKPPTYPLVPSLLSSWVDHVNSIGADLHSATASIHDAPALIADCHGQFERIHPFLDGNGRTGRLLLNLIMVRLGFPPIVILKTQRRRYLNALTQTDAGNTAPLAEIIARAAIASLNTLLPSLASNRDLLPISSFATHEISLAALRQAATRGRLHATLDQHGHWQTTHQAVQDYLNHRYTRTLPTAGSEQDSV
jgi:Fic family protein